MVKNKSKPHDTIYLRQFDRNRFAVRNGNEKIIIPWKGAAPQFMICPMILENKKTSQKRDQRGCKN